VGPTFRYLGPRTNKKAAPYLPGGASIKTKPTFYCPLSIPHSTRRKVLQMVGKPDTMIGLVLYEISMPAMR
jgi:hypothetical protein